VSLPLFLVDRLPAGGSYQLDGPEGHHAATVQRLRHGESLLLGDGRGGTATAVVEAAGRSGLTLTILSRGYAEPPAPRLVVAQGIAKGDRGELAVQAMTEAGVDEIVPWSAARCVAVWRGERGVRARDRWAATAAATSELARRPTSATFVLHQAAATPLTVVDLPSEGDLMLIVGPEGGITDEELAAFVTAGAVPVRLGPTVLRTSTAGLAALCVLSTRLGRW
jgi:16S rRNA (uracil1498-N3)-methyltransferase